MILHPVKASNWVNSDFSEQEKICLKTSGIVPVNDVFFPIWDTPSKLELIRGGRGGGKSTEVFKKKIHKCITTRYFKCYYGRKVFDTVRGSCFETIVACIEDMGLAHQFHYSTANTSSMVITHIATGNKFIPFGSDKAEKLKSIKDPTDIVCEEFDQFTFDDFKDIYPTLRYENAFCQFTAMFNTHAVNMHHWIIKVFFPELYDGEDKSEVDILDGIDILSLFVNFTDNYFIDQEEYSKMLWLACAGNKRLFEAVANGAWGVEENNHPWLYAFEYEKHVRDTVTFKEGRPIYISFDFNNDPVACTLWQFSDLLGTEHSWITCIDEYVGIYKLDELCQKIRTDYPFAVFHITGDRSGRNKDLGRNETLYDIIARMLRVNERLVDTPTHNIAHADSRILCNTVFKHYPNFTISSKCRVLLQDCEIARVADKNNGGAALEKDRAQFKMDAFDSMRYFFQTYFLDYISNKYRIFE